VRLEDGAAEARAPAPIEVDSFSYEV
jgi:hypothetical protein